MGFSFRRKGDDRANEFSEVQVVSSGNDVHEDAAHADLHIKRLKDQHRFDPFMDNEKVEAIDAAIETGNAEKEHVIEESILGENSPYAEVRAAVSCPQIEHSSVATFYCSFPYLTATPGFQH